MFLIIFSCLGFFLTDSARAQESSTYPWEKTWQHEIQTENFTIYYDTNGTDATTFDYVDRVRKALEYGFIVLIQKDGFKPPGQKVEVYMVDFGAAGGELGGLYGQRYPTVAPYKILVNTNISGFFTTPEQTAVHELFHVIQDEYSNFYTEPLWLQEGLADWAKEEVFPDIMYPPGVGLDLKHAYTYVNCFINYRTDILSTTPFTSLSYKAMVFWVYLSDRYGTGVIKSILEASDRHDGLDSVNFALESYGTTFDSVFMDFVTSIYTRTTKESIEYKHKIFETIGPSDNWFYMEPSYGVYRGPENGWDDIELVINISNKGSPLQLPNSYMANYVRIKISPEAESDLNLLFDGDPHTNFSCCIVTKKRIQIEERGELRIEKYPPENYSQLFAIIPVQRGSPLIIEKPADYGEIAVMVVATSFDEGAHKKYRGLYNITLFPALNDTTPPIAIDKEKGKGFIPAFDTLFLLVGILVTVIVLRNRRRA